MTDEKYSPAVLLLADQMEHRMANREKWKRDAAILIDVHQVAFSALASVLKRNLGRKVEDVSKAQEGQICLISHFVQGIELCESSISEGLYSQAAALLKQEVEIVSGIEEYRTDKRKEKKTPLIGKGVTAGFGPVYGQLNDIAHLGRHEIAKNIVSGSVGNLTGASIVPVYEKDLAFALYGQHIHYIILVTQQLDVLFQSIYGKGLNEDEKGWSGGAIGVLLKEGFLKLPDNAEGEEADWIRSMIKIK
ncbi:hypothetical protein FSZ31_11305 [Sphingorhabdus soli]|uniref:Uncharacterized protein n=1 Tax=Flavisphingopyxis soli TaxID=2601267 RepID=A0A5C6U9F7_9SPHN|nr:hypothetical protein [Sphingorhabdus soli]TXC68265.1 hypothetical protein FSZ31_11305 [Sphingorhabdus soli]